MGSFLGVLLTDEKAEQKTNKQLKNKIRIIINNPSPKAQLMIPGQSQGDYYPSILTEPEMFQLVFFVKPVS